MGVWCECVCLRVLYVHIREKGMCYPESIVIHSENILAIQGMTLHLYRIVGLIPNHLEMEMRK